MQRVIFAGSTKLNLLQLSKDQARVDITEEYIVLDKPIKEVGGTSKVKKFRTNQLNLHSQLRLQR